MQAIEIDYIDESEVLTPADDVYHIDKRQFDVPLFAAPKTWERLCAVWLRVPR